MLAQLVAGSDTTSNYLRMTLNLLITTPRVYHSLQKEIDEGIANGTISHPITDAEAKKLPYLQVRLHRFPSSGEVKRMLTQPGLHLGELPLPPPGSHALPQDGPAGGRYPRRQICEGRHQDRRRHVVAGPSRRGLRRRRRRLPARAVHRGHAREEGRDGADGGAHLWVRAVFMSREGPGADGAEQGFR